MKTILSGAGLCCAAIAVACCSDIAKADTWSCEQNIADKAVKRVWIVSGDRLTASNDDSRYRIIRNDERVLMRFTKTGNTRSAEAPRLSPIIDKTTGALIDLNDSVLTTLGAEYKDTATPDATVGHCVLTQP